MGVEYVHEHKASTKGNFITPVFKLRQILSDICRGNDNYLVPIFVLEGVIFLSYGCDQNIYVLKTGRYLAIAASR